MEGWHRRLQTIVGSKHPGFLRIISLLKGELFRAQRISLVGTSKKKQRKAVSKRNAIFKIIKSYDDEVISDICFIHRIASVLIRKNI